MIACASVSGGVIFIPRQLKIKKCASAVNDNATSADKVDAS